MSDIRPSAFRPLAMVRLVEALIWARAQGHRVRFGEPGEFGVQRTGSAGPDRWEREPAARAVHPLGAAVLHFQPEAEEPFEAAAEALHAPIAWIRGFAETLDGEPLSSHWGEPMDRAQYALGAEAGAKFLQVYHRRMRVVH